ncbi:MAG: class I SAM-dependent methyltransferase [Halodesulfurarchaeum sp.]
MVDPFGRAIRDCHRGEMTGDLIQRDGDDTQVHPIEEFYLEGFDERGPDESWVADQLEGPLLDIGAGAGRHALHFQERFETVAIEVSDALVDTMRERGVRDARRGDLLCLEYSFEENRFAAALAIGTQIGLARSMEGLRRFLSDLATITTDDATAVVDSYDPTDLASGELLGYRDDSTPGLAFRVMHFAYDGEVGPTLLFRLFSPSRLVEATADTPWEVSEIRRLSSGGPYYRAALEK